MKIQPVRGPLVGIPGESIFLQKVSFCGGKTNIFIVAAVCKFGAKKVVQRDAAERVRPPAGPLESFNYRD